MGSESFNLYLTDPNVSGAASAAVAALSAGKFKASIEPCGSIVRVALWDEDRELHVGSSLARAETWGTDFHFTKISCVKEKSRINLQNDHVHAISVASDLPVRCVAIVLPVGHEPIAARTGGYHRTSWRLVSAVVPCRCERFSFAFLYEFLCAESASPSASIVLTAKMYLAAIMGRAGIE